MKFAHLADCHIGSWRDRKLRILSLQSFVVAIDVCREREVDFILIAGDLFNTSLPPIDDLKQIVRKLNELKKDNIPVYIIPGSHDYSPSGKTMIDVLESAGLVINVCKGEVEGGKLKLNFIQDKKTGVKITGIVGKKGMLDRKYYETLYKSNLEQEPGFKIFMLHTAITELKPKELEKMDSMQLSLLPRGFNYYAAGHVHYILEKDIDGYGKIVYPGALFPANFAELEKFKAGGFYIYEDGLLSYEKLNIVNVESLNLNCEDMLPEEVKELIYSKIKNKEFYNTIVLMRLRGILKAGKPSDIDFKDIFTALKLKGAYYVMKNTIKLTSKEFEKLNRPEETMTNEEIEQALINEHKQVLPGLGIEQSKKIMKELMQALANEKGDLTIQEHQDRIIKDVEGILEDPYLHD